MQARPSTTNWTPWSGTSRTTTFSSCTTADRRTGEDGDFSAKVAALQELDTRISRLLDLPDVLVVAGDHSTPSIMGSHSWHPSL